MSERIQPKINREFTTGQGSWQGDQVWTGETFFGHTAFIIVTSPSPDDIRETRLSYPYIKPVPKKENWVRFLVGSKNPDPAGTSVNWKLTDGVYEFGTQELSITEPGFDADVADSWIIPEDWDIEQTQLILQTIPSGGSADLCFDDISLTVPSKPQYLPLMGIG